MRVRYENWVHGLNGDWLISRQRFFGVPFPLWYPVKASGEPDYDHPITPSEDRLPIDPTNDVPEGYDESQRDVPGGFTAEPDIMDTWATSSLTPQIVTRWEEPDEASKALFKATFPDGSASAGSGHHPHLAVLDRGPRPSGEQVPAVGARHAVGLDPGPRPQEDVEVKGQRRRAEQADRAVRRRRGALLAAAARLGLDATYDEGQMKIGRRLAISCSTPRSSRWPSVARTRTIMGETADAVWNPADVTEPLDRAVMAKLALVIRQATDALNAYEHSKALEVIESFFWQFCDDYIELVKNRAYGTADAHGKCRATRP